MKNTSKLLLICVMSVISVVATAEYYDCGDMRYWIVNNEHLKFMNLFDTEYSGELIVPDSVMVDHLGCKLPVTEMAEKALAKCSVTSIVLPHTLKSMEKNAFGGCQTLTDIDLSNTQLRYPYKLTEEPSNIENVNLPNELERFGDNTFRYTQIKEIKQPDSLYLPWHRTYWGTPLEKITFGKKIGFIEQEAFYDCKNLRSIDIPDYIFSIESYAFKGTSISELTIHPYMEFLFFGCFSGMPYLTTVRCFLKDPTAIPLCEDPFYRTILSNCTLWVPEGSVDLYRSLPDWERFKEIRAMDESGLPILNPDEINEPDEIYDLSGRKVKSMIPGNVYIVNGQKIHLRK